MHARSQSDSKKAVHYRIITDFKNMIRTFYYITVINNTTMPSLCVCLCVRAVNTCVYYLCQLFNFSHIRNIMCDVTCIFPSGVVCTHL